jgi:CRISPR/Cas system-associated endonuclease/helicase Cas3
MIFYYSNHGPIGTGAPYRTNEIRLSWHGDDIVYSRHYVCKDGTLDKGIEGVLHESERDGKPNADEIAKGIHWGVCGWSAGSHQIWQLIDRVQEFIDSK